MKTLDELISRQRLEPPTLADFPRAVGERLRRQRMAFEWRQADLADRAGLSVQTIKSVEKGEAISYENLLRLLLALGHGADFLRMLEAPNFPNLRSHERYLELKNVASPTLAVRRVRPRVPEKP